MASPWKEEVATSPVFGLSQHLSEATWKITKSRVRRAICMLKFELKFDFLRSTKFELLSHIKTNEINNCDFAEISVKGGHRDDSPPAPK
jgi:ribosome-associated toxin RatA of RatAB toxin-antitoxin module